MFADVFNDCVLGFALGHAAQIGLLDQLKASGTVDPISFSRRTGTQAEGIAEICLNLERAKIIQRHGCNIVKGPSFDVAFENAGYFQWFLLGYGGLLAAPEATHGTATARGRNGAAIASGSARIGSFHVDPILFPYALQRAGSSVVDLGCGSGQRLIAMAKADISLRATGIEIDPTVVEIGKQLIDRENVGDRVQIIRADVTRLEEGEWRDIPQDLIMMSFMGHDMWPHENAVRVFAQLRRSFGRCRCFLMSDTVRGNEMLSDTPIFTKGFALSHALMGKYVPRIDEWDDLFVETGWTLIARQSLGVPDTYMFDLVPST